MGKMNWGERGQSNFLEVFKPQPGIAHRFAILSLDCLTFTESHWVETPRGTKGFYQCIHGACCQSGLFPNGATQYYTVPIWLYLNPPDVRTGAQGTADGILKLLRMPASTYDLLVTLSSQLDLLTVDLTALAQPSGKSVKTQLFSAQGAALITKEQRAGLMEQLGDIGQMIERSIHRTATEADWAVILSEYAQGAAGAPLGALPQAPQMMVQAASPQAVLGAFPGMGARPALPQSPTGAFPGAPAAAPAQLRAAPAIQPQAAPAQGARPAAPQMMAAPAPAAPQQAFQATSGFAQVRPVQGGVTLPAAVTVASAPLGSPLGAVPQAAPVEQVMTPEEVASMLGDDPSLQ